MQIPCVQAAPVSHCKGDCVTEGQRKSEKDREREPPFSWDTRFDLPLLFITSPYIAHCLGACSAKGE